MVTFGGSSRTASTVVFLVAVDSVSTGLTVDAVFLLVLLERFLFFNAEIESGFGSVITLYVKTLFGPFEYSQTYFCACSS